MNNLFIIPQANQSIIAKVEQEKIVQVGKIDLPYNSKSIITDNKYIVSLCFDEKQIRIYDTDGNLIHAIENQSYKAINCKDNVVYLGGEYNGSLHRKYKGELFSILDTNKPSFEIQTFNLPIERIEGKSIDDILIRENELFLVDNCIYPKYIIYYDITDPCNPAYKECDRLPNNGTYEHIEKGDVNSDCMVLFCSCVGRWGSAQHIIVSGKYNMHLIGQSDSGEENHHLCIGRFSLYLGGTYYKDICLADDSLLVIRNNQLRSIKLKSFSFFGFSKRVKTHMSEVDRIIKSPEGYPIVISPQGFQLLTNGKNKWTAQWDFSAFWGAD